jgi:hypothetical protein
MQHFTSSRISDTSKTGDGNGKFFTFMERSEYFAVVVTNPPQTSGLAHLASRMPCLPVQLLLHSSHALEIGKVYGVDGAHCLPLRQDL